MTIYGFSSTNCQAQFSAESLSLGGTILHAGSTHFIAKPFKTLEYKRTNIRLIHNNLYAQKELNAFRGEVSHSFSKLVMGLSFSSFGYQHYRMNTLSFALSKTLTRRLSMGITSDWNCCHHYGSSQKPKFLKLGVDFLLELGEKPHFTYAKLSYTFIPPKFKTERYKSSLELLSGFSLVTSPNSRWLSEIRFVDLKKFSLHTGFEYSIRNFFLRMGCLGLPIRPTYGVGLILKAFSFNLGSNWTIQLGHSFSFDMTYNF